MKGIEIKKEFNEDNILSITKYIIEKHNIIENQEIDIYKEIKPWLLSTSFYKSKVINY